MDKKANVFGLLSKESLVFYLNGKIDWNETLVAIQSRMEDEINQAAETDSSIIAALNEVFDQLPAGSRIPQPLAVNLAVAKLVNVSDITAMSEMTNKVNEYLERSTIFKGKRGRSGGLGREV